MTALQTYLAMASGFGDPIARHITAEGRAYAPPSATLAPDQRDLLRAARRRAPTPAMRHCFDNAQRLVLADRTGRLTYVEGYAFCLIPVLHAWVALDGGVLIDPTWGHAAAEWYGIDLGGRDVLRAFRRTPRRRFSFSMLDDYEMGWPLIPAIRRRNRDAA